MSEQLCLYDTRILLIKILTRNLRAPCPEDAHTYSLGRADGPLTEAPVTDNKAIGYLEPTCQVRDDHTINIGSVRLQ